MLPTPPKLLWQSILWLKMWIPLGLTVKRECTEENHSLIFFFFFNVLHSLTLPKPFTWNMHAFSLSLPVSRCSVWACSVLCLGYFIQHSTWKLHLMDTTERLRQKKKKLLLFMLPAFWKSGKILTSPEHLLYCSCQIISQPVTLQFDSTVFIFKKLCIVVSVSVYDTFFIIIMVVLWPFRLAF